MKHNNKVSIIVPVYNTSDYLTRCLDSILSQTYSNWELIIIDDGSKDNSLNICNEYASKNKQITVLSQVNSGVSSARNRGIEVSTGEFITFIDSDDWISPDYLEMLINKQQETNSDIVVGNLSIVDEEINKSIPFPSENLLLTREEFLKLFGKLYSETLISGPCVKLYSSDIIKNHSIQFDPNRNLGEDLIFNLEYLTFCNRLCFFSQVIYFYRSVYNFSLSHKFNLNKTEIQYALYKNVLEFCKKQGCLDVTNQKYINTSFFRQTYIQMQNIILSDLKTKEKKQYILTIIDRFLPNSLLNQIEIVSIHNTLVVFLVRHRFINLLSVLVHFKDKLKTWKVTR